MAFNQFTRARISDGRMSIAGTSPPPMDDVLGIFVAAESGEWSKAGSAAVIRQDWRAELDLGDPAPNLAADRQVVLYGVEIRRDPFLAITWTQTLPIE